MMDDYKMNVPDMAQGWQNNAAKTQPSWLFEFKNSVIEMFEPYDPIRIVTEQLDDIKADVEADSKLWKDMIRERGTYEAPRSSLTDEQKEQLREFIRPKAEAILNFLNIPIPSEDKTETPPPSASLV